MIKIALDYIDIYKSFIYDTVYILDIVVALIRTTSIYDIYNLKPDFSVKCGTPIL